MKYLGIAEVSQRWGISPRRLQTLCAAGKVQGAVRFGKAWMIPADTEKPVDGRTKAGKAQQAFMDMPMPRKTPILHMTDLYNTPGEAEKNVEALGENPEAQTLLRAWIAYSRGQIDQVYESAHYLLHKHSGFYAVLSAGMLLAMCAIWRGDLILWRQAKKHIAEAPAEGEVGRELMSLSIMAVDSMLYDVESFPEWFRAGRFELIHRDALPAAKVFYAKYLYASAYGVATKQLRLQGLQGLTLMRILPVIIEPMISQAVADRSVVTEIYLRMICAVVYHNSGDDEQAVYHIDRAIVKALPDRLYGLLAEYGRTLYGLLEQRLTRVDADAWTQVKILYSRYNAGWSKLSGSVRGKDIATTLTPKERAVAKLAAFGMKNGEIGVKLHMSLSAVKQAINSVSNKTGMSRDEFAAIL